MDVLLYQYFTGLWILQWISKQCIQTHKSYSRHVRDIEVVYLDPQGPDTLIFQIFSPPTEPGGACKVPKMVLRAILRCFEGRFVKHFRLRQNLEEECNFPKMVLRAILSIGILNVYFSKNFGIREQHWGSFPCSTTYAIPPVLLLSTNLIPNLSWSQCYLPGATSCEG